MRDDMTEMTDAIDAIEVFDVFDGEICGFGTTSGHRVVIGRWDRSPLGAFADVMLQAPGGRRTLFAPDPIVADYVAATYSFDDVCVVPVDAFRAGDALVVRAGPLHAEVTVGRRSWLGVLLRAVPRRVARSRRWAALVDPVARVALRGVRTRGAAGNGRREWYGATDVHDLVAVVADLDGADLGTLADVWPPVAFGFGSVPRRPSIVDVTTTVAHQHG